MKTITIYLPDVEATMLLEVQKRNKAFRGINALLARLIAEVYADLR